MSGQSGRQKCTLNCTCQFMSMASPLYKRFWMTLSKIYFQWHAVEASSQCSTCTQSTLTEVGEPNLHQTLPGLVEPTHLRVHWKPPKIQLIEHSQNITTFVNDTHTTHRNYVTADISDNRDLVANIQRSIYLSFPCIDLIINFKIYYWRVTRKLVEQ